MDTRTIGRLCVTVVAILPRAPLRRYTALLSLRAQIDEPINAASAGRRGELAPEFITSGTVARGINRLLAGIGFCPGLILVTSLVGPLVGASRKQNEIAVWIKDDKATGKRVRPSRRLQAQDDPNQTQHTSHAKASVKSSTQRHNNRDPARKSGQRPHDEIDRG